MRIAITLGITKSGTTEIITGAEVPLQTQKRDFHTLVEAGKSEYKEIQYWESGRGMRRSKTFGSKGTINFNSAHRVEKQQAKGKNKEKLPDLSPSTGKGSGVDFNAAHPVHLQQDKKRRKSLPDLNKLREHGETGEKSGVNWDAVTSVERQGKPSKAKKPSRKGAKKSSAKTATAASPEPAKDEKPAEGGPTL